MDIQESVQHVLDPDLPASGTVINELDNFTYDIQSTNSILYEVENAWHNDLFESTVSQLQTQPDSEIFMCVMQNYKDKPKEVFIEDILELANNKTNELEFIRDKLFRAARNRDDFPYKEGPLRRRLEPRTKSGASVEAKLAKDCFIQHRASEGEYLDELYDVIGVSKNVIEPQRSRSSRQNLENSQEAHSNIHLSTREAIISLLRQLHELRSEYNKSMTDMKTSIETIMNEKEQSRQRAQKLKDELSDLRRLQKELESKCKVIDRVKEENMSLVNRISELEVAYRQTKTEKDLLEKSIAELKPVLHKSNSNIDEIDKKFSNLGDEKKGDQKYN